MDLIFGMNVTHWWGIENQNFGVDPKTLPFLRFFDLLHPYTETDFFLKKTDADRFSRAHFLS